MAKKIVLILLFVVVLLQLSFAKYRRNKKPFPNDKIELIKFAGAQIDEVANDLGPKLVDMVKAVVKDIKEDDQRTEAENKVLAKLEEFLEYIAKTDKSETTAPKQNGFVIVQLSNVFKFKNDEDKSDKIIAILNKHGWTATRDKFNADFAEKIEEIGKKTQTYLDSVNDADKEEEQDLTEWLEKVKDKMSNKINLYIEFLIITLQIFGV